MIHYENCLQVETVFKKITVHDSEIGVKTPKTKEKKNACTNSLAAFLSW